MDNRAVAYKTQGKVIDSRPVGTRIAHRKTLQ